VHGTHAATSKVENSAQGSSCQLKFVHAYGFSMNFQRFSTLSKMQVIASHHFNLFNAFSSTIVIIQWKRISDKQSARWQHPSRLKGSAFFSLQKNSSLYETQQRILRISYAI
jgi:hypothetical protein